jgi:uncharacterized OB-fold protein
MSGARSEFETEQDTHTAGFAERIRANQQKLTAELKPHYDFIVCGSGSSGSVVARRLAENPKVRICTAERARSSRDVNGPTIINIGRAKEVQEAALHMEKDFRPAPVPDAATGPFWAAAERGVLLLARCSRCDRIPYPPRPRCPECLSDALNWVELSGRASLNGWTEVHVDAGIGRTAPVTIVECALAEDPRSILVALDEGGTVRSCRPDAPLRIRMQPDANGWSYPVVDAATDEAAA